MELRNFYILIKKHKYTLIGIPLLAMLVTFLLLRGRPNTYQSKLQIATGIVDLSQRVISTQEGYVPDTKVMEEFTNLIQTIKLNKVIDQVSFKLFLHDLINPVPFRPAYNKYIHLNEQQRVQAINLLNEKLNNFETLDLNRPQEKMVDSLISRVGYDRETLEKRILIYRLETSDFIELSVDAESPQLSSFIANNLADRFITYYSNYVGSGHTRTNDFFAKILREKKDAMDKKIAALQVYKVKNGILDIADESKDIYAEISDLELHQQQAEKDVIAYSGALKSIDSKFDPKNREYLEATSSKINGQILGTRERLRAVNDKYIQSDFKPHYKKSIDSLQDILSLQINESSDKYISNPMVSKDNLIQEKLKMQNQMELARYSATSLKIQLSSLKSRLSGMVPAQAGVKSFERDIDVATKEYLDVQDKFNQANVSSIAPVQLRQLQSAMPGKAQSSKKIIFTALSGIASALFYLVILLIIYYLDNSIRNWEDLERLTDMRILGHLNVVPNMLTSARNKTQEAKSKNEMRIYRDLLRSIRFEIDSEVKNCKILAITSLNKGEGKTLFSFSLAYAYSLTNKKVLLIDGNFSNPVISQTVKSKDFIEDFLTGDHLLKAKTDDETIDDIVSEGKAIRLLEINNGSSISETIQRLRAQTAGEYNKQESISIFGNKGGDVSLLEISNETHIQKKMDELRSLFDVIIIEAGSLNTLNKSKEWITIADKSVAVFENNRSLSRTNLPAINYLRSLNGKMLGWVLNKVDIHSMETA